MTNDAESGADRRVTGAADTERRGGFWSALSSLEDRVDAMRQRLFGEGDAARAILQPYFSFGTPDRIQLRARVLRGALLDSPHPVEAGPAGDEALAGEDGDLDDLIASRWEVLRTMWDRFETDEVAGAEVEVPGTSACARSDAEGYLSLEIAAGAARPRPEDARWHDVPLRLTASSEPGARTTVPVLIPGQDARFAIVSDIDDTIVETHATSKLKMIPLVLTRSAAQRTALPGVAAFYKALERGGRTAQARSLNPVFYVSSSPWNLYDVLVEYMALRSIPLGPIFLRDYGLSRHGPIGEHHEAHKGRAIGTLMDTYPDLGFVLIGDSGQRDPQVYAQAARDYPGRVKAVYLRDVSPAQGPEFAAKAAPFVADLETMGVPTLLSPDTRAMALHAAEHGLVTEEAGRRIAEGLPVPG